MESHKACGGEGRKEAGGQELTAGHGLFGTGSEASRPEAVLLVKTFFFSLRFPPTKKRDIALVELSTEPPSSSPGRHLDRFPCRNFFLSNEKSGKKKCNRRCRTGLTTYGPWCYPSGTQLAEKEGEKPENIAGVPPFAARNQRSPLCSEIMLLRDRHWALRNIGRIDRCFLSVADINCHRLAKYSRGLHLDLLNVTTTATVGMSFRPMFCAHIAA